MRAVFDETLILDRHFMFDIESKVCIASIDEGMYGMDHTLYTIDTLRLIYAQKFDNQLNFRELPVSLLRLYFSGQKRLKRCIRQIPDETFQKLYKMALESDAEEEEEEDKSDNYTFVDRLYSKKCLRVERYLAKTLDMCFSSFETCLSAIIKMGDNRSYLFGLFDSLKKDEYFANIHIPEVLRVTSTLPDAGIFIWLTCMWRLNVTLLLEQMVKPWESDEAKSWLCYKLKLFRCTHLDLLTMMTKHASYRDKEITDNKIFKNYYPSCHRVICAEELPDFIAYATDNWKTGSNLKERGSLDEKMGHIYVNKTGDNICKIRNLFDIIIRYGEEHPIIYDSLKNVLKCVMLGNLPGSLGSLNLNTQIRVNYSFFPEVADQVIPEEIFNELTKNKALKRSRAKKKVSDELIYVKTHFKLWLLLCRHWVLYLLKEHHFFIIDTSKCFADILSYDFKFSQCREIVLIGNGRCRNLLSIQGKNLPFDVPFDWSVIEFEEKSAEKSKGIYDTKSGEIRKFHPWALKVTRKVEKDDFSKILIKKMTGTEKSMTLAEKYTSFYYNEEKGESPSVNQVISLDQLHQICRYMSENKTEKLQTRFLQVIGMSRVGLNKIRNWLFCYYEYEIPDNSLKDLIVEFQKDNMKDYMILKTVLKLVEYYKNDQMFHLPLFYAKKQIYALRKLLTIEDFEPTPKELGFAYQCPGCHKFANTIIEPIDYTKNSAYHTCSPSLSTGKNPSKKTTPPKPVFRRYPLSFTKDNFGQISASNVAQNVPLRSNDTKELVAPGEENDNVSFGTENGKNKNPKKRGRRPKERKNANQEKSVFNNANVTSCFLSSAFYNQEDNELYCGKNSAGHSERVIAQDTPRIVIMRRKDKGIVVLSNKKVPLTKVCVYPEEEGASTKRTSKSTSSGGFMSISHNKEQAAKKLEWLLARREFVIAGDTEKTGEENECDTDLCRAIETPKLKKVKDNKKIILGNVNEAIYDKGYTCSSPLKKVGMIGVVKNGKVQCTECPSMTEFKNFNTSNYGITCSRHKTASDSDHELRFNIDKRSVKYMNIKRDMDNNYTHRANEASDLGNNFLSYSPLSLSSSSSTHKTGTNSLKNQLHPLDIVFHNAPSKNSSSLRNDEKCEYCEYYVSKFRLTAIGHNYKIVKFALCKSCYDCCRSHQTKTVLPLLKEIYSHLKHKIG